jgi:crotonobetainyl-CoA:carnitine CoA-transferase CaiB-like acyl-CoA transferase
MSEHLGAATFDPPVGPIGDARLLSPDYRPVPTEDGYITVGPNTNAQAFAFFDAIGRPELKTDPRFRDATSRTANAAAYLEIRAGAMRQRKTAEWLAILGERDVPAAAYNSLDDLLEDPHLKATGFFAPEDHPSEGRIRRTAIPNRFSGGMREDDLPAPRLGEGSRAILAEAGYDDAAIEALLSAGVIATADPVEDAA